MQSIHICHLNQLLSRLVRQQRSRHVPVIALTANPSVIPSIAPTPTPTAQPTLTPTSSPSMMVLFSPAFEAYV